MCALSIWLLQMQLCKECFYEALEDEVHNTIITNRLFSRGEIVALGASGGKDSTVLAHIVSLLNERHKCVPFSPMRLLASAPASNITYLHICSYGLKLWLLSIDEGISGYRDDSLETVKRNEKQYNVPLKIVSYKELYGWTMDEIVQQIGTKNNCTFCGVFRRQALDRGAILIGANKIATGHNADDMAETVMLNLLRGDLPRYARFNKGFLNACAHAAMYRSWRVNTVLCSYRLKRCTNAITGAGSVLPRVKPFKYTYEKEIVMYAYYKKLDYFSTECVYAPYAARGLAREYVKDVELIRPSAIIDIIQSAEQMQYCDGVNQHLLRKACQASCGGSNQYKAAVL